MVHYSTALEAELLSSYLGRGRKLSEALRVLAAMEPEAHPSFDAAVPQRVATTEAPCARTLVVPGEGHETMRVPVRETLPASAA